MTDVIDDRRDLFRAKGVAVNFGAHRIKAVGRSGGRDGDQVAGWLGEAAERRLRKPDLVEADDAVIGDQQRREQDF